MRCVLCLCLPNIYRNYHLFEQSFSLYGLIAFFRDATWATLLPIGLAILVARFWSLKYAVVGALGAGFWGCVAVQSILGTPGYFFVAHTVILVVGVISGIGIGSAHDITNRGGVETDLETTIGLIFGIFTGIPLGIGAAYLGGVAVYRVLVAQTLVKAVIGSTIGAIVGLLLGAIVSGFIFGFVKGTLRARLLNIGVERVVSVIAGSIIAVTTAMGGIVGTAVGPSGVEGLQLSWNHYILPNLTVAPGFVIYYMLGYYRLPLYPFSAYSSLRTYRASLKNPPHAFNYLHASSLHWDERVYPPLPSLKQTLILASRHVVEHEQLVNRTIEELLFIARERATQSAVIYPVIRDVVLRELKWRKRLREIEQARQDILSRLQRDDTLLPPEWTTSFILLNNACSEAARYRNTSLRSIKQEAMEEMIRNLARIERRLFDDVLANKTWQEILESWEEIAYQELDEVNLIKEGIESIKNPYIVGKALKTNDHPFVGRQDIIYKLDQILINKANGFPIFLTGEQRMGKTSILNQLPNMLNSRCIPVVINVQSGNITTNATTLLQAIINEIFHVLKNHGYRINRLESNILNVSFYENENLLYYHFGTWLKSIDRALGRVNQTLLLAFDEFERLETAATRQQLNIDLLLNCFSDIQQNYSHIALLFSGTRTPTEMRHNWSEYFTGIESLSIHYLTRDEATRLILHPTPDFPGASFFEKEIVREIMHLSGNHPFYIQALCSQIIDYLKDAKQEKARIQDVDEAKQDVVDALKDTYFAHLWGKGSTEEQRQCLKALKQLGRATIQQVVAEQGNKHEMNTQQVEKALAKLCKRGLALQEEVYYRIAAPLIEDWIECMLQEEVEQSELPAI